MWVCMFVCMYVCLYVCQYHGQMRSRMYVCMYVSMYVHIMDGCGHIYIYMYVCMYVCMSTCAHVHSSSRCPPTSLESLQSKSSGLGPRLGGLHQKRLQKSACCRWSLPSPPPTYIGWFVASSVAISFGSGAGLVDRAVASNHRALTREGLWVGLCRRFSL